MLEDAERLTWFLSTVIVDSKLSDQHITFLVCQRAEIQACVDMRPAKRTTDLYFNTHVNMVCDQQEKENDNEKREDQKKIMMMMKDEQLI